MHITNRKISFVALLIAVFVFCLVKPYFLWGFIGSSNGAQFIISLILCGLCLLKIKPLDSKERLILLLFAAVLLFRCVNGGYNFAFTLAIVMLMFIPFVKDVEFVKAYDYFTTIYACFMGAGLVVWVLSLVGIVHPYATMMPLNELKSIVYDVYPFMVKSPDSIRFFGPFDEPGVVGTTSALMVIISGFDFSKLRNIILLISGLCSISFFFYITIFAYSLYYLCSRRKFGYILLVFSLLVTAYFATRNIEVLNDSLWSRFEIDSSTGKVAGDNRMTEAGMDYFLSVIGTEDFYFGLSKDDYEYFEMLSIGSSSIVSTILGCGLIYVFGYILVFVLLKSHYDKSQINRLIYFLIVFGTLYQRPFFNDGSFVFLFTFLARFNSLKELKIETK